MEDDVFRIISNRIFKWEENISESKTIEKKGDAIFIVNGLRFHLRHSQFLSKRAISLFVGSDLSQYGEIEKRLIFGRNWLEDKDGNKKGNTRREKSLTSQFGAKWLASERKWSKRKKGKKVADDCVKIRLSSKEKKLVFFIAFCKRFFFFFVKGISTNAFHAFKTPSN